MSMELYVFSDRTVASMAEWQEAIYADGFDIKLYEHAPFEDLHGFLPMRLDGAGSGVEVDHADSAETIAWFEQDGPAFDRRWQRALSFTWGGDFRELIVAFATAASYSRATQGVVYDCEEGRIIEPDEALAIARQLAVDLKDQLGPPRYVWTDAR